MTLPTAWETGIWVGGGGTLTGDVVGSFGYIDRPTAVQADPAAPQDREYFQVHAGTLVGVGDGVFVTHGSYAYTPGSSADLHIEFFGVSGAFAGLRGSGTAPPGADPLDLTVTYELSR